MPEPRLIAGIRCDEVLEHLSDYLDGAVPPDVRVAIEGHLPHCDWCERFGGEFAATVAGLSRALADQPGPDPAVLDRLADRLASEP